MKAEMAFLLSTLRKTFFWNYARNTWQWDILCVVILIFIFLTPKNWFDSRPAVGTQNPTSTMLVSPEVIENGQDRSHLQQRLQALTGRPAVEVVEVRKVYDKDGKALGYEVDIR